MASPNRYWLNFKYIIGRRKPLLIARLLATYARILLAGARPLRYVDFALDFACNLNCVHCFAKALIRPEDGAQRMAVEDYRRVAEECRELGAVNFSFQGGEPLLFPQLEEIIKACAPRSSLISVTTNGTLLDAERIRALESWGVDILTVSLDSAIPEEHDRFRGRAGTFAKTLQGIRSALANGLRVTIGTTVSHENLHSEGLRRLIEMAEEMRVIMCFNLAVPAGRWRENEEILLTPEDMAFIHSLTRKYRYLRTDFEANYWHWGCGAIKEILYITPYGEVLPCPFIHISFGNVLREPVSAIRERALECEHFADYIKRCLAAEDKDFIERYLSLTFGQPHLPLDAAEVFSDAPLRHPS